MHVYYFFLFIGSLALILEYLHLDDGYRTFRISSSLIDFYLIAFGTHMDTSLPSYLCCLLGLGTCLALTLICHSIFYLEALFTIKTYIQLWNRPAFILYSSELICTHSNH